MAKNPVVGWFHDPITAILGTRGKVAVLRVLVQATTPLGQRELTGRTGMALRTVELAVDDLLTVGIIDRIPGGRERLVHLRTGHRLAPAVQALLRAGADFWPALRTELRSLPATLVDADLLAVAVVGRSALREERLGDPMDLLILALTDAAAQRWVDRYLQLGEGIVARHGVVLRPIGYGVEAARAMWAGRTKAAERAVREGEWVHGAVAYDLLTETG